MLIPDTTVTKMLVPNKHPNLPEILITTNISVLYVHLNNEPDIAYERDADIVLGWYKIRIPKEIIRNKQIYFYQTSGSDGYVSLTEAF